MKKTDGLNVVSFPGAAPDIVLLHGLGGTTRYWTSMMDFSICDRSVTALDLLGFGDSPKPYCKYTIEKHLAALIPELEDQNDIVLVGHSLGAMLALAYASRYPHKVKKLVLISLPYFGKMKVARRWFTGNSGGWIYTNFVVMMIVCIFTRRVASYFLPYFIKSYPRAVVQDLVKHNVFSSTTSLWNVLYKHDPKPDSERLPKNMAVTCIHSNDDDLAPVSNVEKLAKQFGWCFVPLDGTRHHPWLRKPGACWAIICEGQSS